MRSVEIAVIGAGPRGVIAVERLCCNAIDLGIGTPIVVHLIDPFPAGAGRIWHTDQPRELLMNTVASDITVFTDDTVQCAGPIVPGPSHYQWAHAVAQGDIRASGEETRREAQRMLPWSYPTRPMQGEYLQWALRRIISEAPPNIEVHVHRTAATAFTNLAGEYAVDTADEQHLVVDAVVLAVGHFDTIATPRTQELAESARRAGLLYIPPANASEVDLDGIDAGENVIVNGMGLNFFDYVTLLTAGRGGHFTRSGTGELQYVASGNEPRILAGSRRGVPYLARAEHEIESVTRYQPLFITPEVIKGFRLRAHTASVNFRREVWPLVQKETAWVYYSTLLAGDRDATTRLRSCLHAVEWGDDQIERILDELVPEPDDRLDWDTIDRPAGNLRFATRGDYTDWVQDKLDQDYRASEDGPTTHALKAVGAIMRDLRDEVRQIISHGGIDGLSYRDHIDSWFSGLNNLIASGPPRSRVAELHALAQAGVVTFIGPDTRVSVTDQAQFSASSPAVDEPLVGARVLIDAFLPKNDIRATSDPLLRSMVEAGECRPHHIPSAVGAGYETGGIDVEETMFRVIRADGRPQRAVYSYGPPIESVQWVTAIGARPGVNSRTLLQADAIARSILEPVASETNSVVAVASPATI
ncbi:FAD/NAD(P)-binding protein [Nocardia jejuensis]|uniref:FAD/NAD(P)-binding protein n=1 Tax=Nocardia jejuensis TaxID=328049 RepID=UPI00083744D1|nr:FAD/NAD(P)-binding protein [Nocardia jejuensis]